SRVTVPRRGLIHYSLRDEQIKTLSAARPPITRLLLIGRHYKIPARPGRKVANNCRFKIDLRLHHIDYTRSDCGPHPVREHQRFTWSNGNAVCNSSTPASVTLVPATSNLRKFLNSFNSISPLSVMSGPMTKKFSKFLSSFNPLSRGCRLIEYSSVNTSS